MNAGMRPLTASIMILPVGVGRTSPGPIGVEGLTMTAARPRSATMASTSRSAANPLWGAPHIHGELLKLGFEGAQSTVAQYMSYDPGAAPAPPRRRPA